MADDLNWDMLYENLWALKNLNSNQSLDSDRPDEVELSGKVKKINKLWPFVIVMSDN